jgi:hypothetical protein
LRLRRHVLRRSDLEAGQLKTRKSIDKGLALAARPFLCRDAAFGRFADISAE